MFEQLFGGSSPELKTAELDPITKQLISGLGTEAGKSDAALAAKYNDGVSAAGAQAAQSDEQGDQRAAGTGENAAMAQAIRSQYRGIGGGQIDKITRANELNMPMQRAHLLDMATKARFAQTQAETQNNMALMQANSDAEIARANALYGVLSGSGTMAGAYIGSRAGGRRSGGGNINGFSQPNMGSAYEMNNFGGPNTLGGNDMAAKFGGR